jgi:transposase
MDDGLFHLTQAQQAELSAALRHDPKPYMRERCAAILKVCEGKTLKEVAAGALLTPHSPDTLHDWCLRYQQEGLDGLRIRPGRGRKPAFSPSAAKRGGTRASAGASASIARTARHS